MTDDARAIAARVLAASPSAMRTQDVRAHIAERRKGLLVQPPRPAKDEPDFTAPVPVLDAPHQFARDFWAKRAPPALPEPPKQKAKTERSGRAPTGDLGARHARFRVVDGGDNQP